MNTANLQLEGMLLAISALMNALGRKGLLSTEEIAAALSEAEEAARKDELRPKGLSASNVEAVLFPIRFLQAVNTRPSEAKLPAFSHLATAVGETKIRPERMPRQRDAP